MIFVGRWRCVMCGEVEECDVWGGGGMWRSVMCWEVECDVWGGGGV